MIERLAAVKYNLINYARPSKRGRFIAFDVRPEHLFSERRNAEILIDHDQPVGGMLMFCDHGPDGLTRAQEGTRLSATDRSGIDDKKCAPAGGWAHLRRLTEGSKLRRLAEL